MTDINAIQFPSASFRADSKTNIAIQVYGRRFLADQTPIEYLSEFLLVFHSKKSEKKITTDELKMNQSENSFNVSEDSRYYFPKSRLPLKLFSFF